MNQRSFDVLSLDNILIKGNYLKNAKQRLHRKLLFMGPKRKIPLFPEMQVRRKIFTRATVNLFFNEIN